MARVTLIQIKQTKKNQIKAIWNDSCGDQGGKRVRREKVRDSKGIISSHWDFRIPALVSRE